MFFANYKTMQEELAAKTSELAAKTSELESLRSSSALTTPLSATPTSVVSRNPFHPTAPSSRPPVTLSQRFMEDGFEVVGATHASSSSLKGDVSSPKYDDEDEEEVEVPAFVDAFEGGKQAEEMKVGGKVRKSKSVAAPAPMASDVYPTRMKSAFKCICSCGEFAFVIGRDGGTGAMKRHREVCDAKYEEEPRRDDFSLMEFKKNDKKNIQQKIGLIRTFEVRKMSEADVAALARFGKQKS